MARSDGPQHVTVRGRDEVVVVAAEEFHRLKGDRTGAALVEAMQASPYREIDIEPPARTATRARCDAVSGRLLDTNVLSELRRPKPNQKVIDFVAARPLDLLFVSIVTAAEIRFGIEAIADPVRRAELNGWLAVISQ